MANTYRQIYLQTVFAVKCHMAIFNMAWRSTVWGVIGNLVNETGCKTLIINGVDRVQLLNRSEACYIGLLKEFRITYDEQYIFKAPA